MSYVLTRVTCESVVFVEFLGTQEFVFLPNLMLKKAVAKSRLKNLPFKFQEWLEHFRFHHCYDWVSRNFALFSFSLSSSPSSCLSSSLMK